MSAEAAKEIMRQFRCIVQQSGFTVEGLKDLINTIYLPEAPVCSATVFKWAKEKSNTIPRGDRLLAIMNFVQARRRSRKIHPVKKKTSKTNKPNRKR